MDNVNNTTPAPEQQAVVPAKRVFTWEDVLVVKEESKLKAALCAFPFIGTILFLVEKDDAFVKYYGALSTLNFLANLVLGFTVVYPMISFAFFVFTAYKAYSGEAIKLGVVTEWAIKLMNAI